MKPTISIIGSGDIGGNLARLLVRAGYEVALANSRGPDSLQPFVEELGERFHPMDLAGVVACSEILIVAPNWRNLDAMPVFDVTGKIVVDTTNPYKEDGSFYDLQGEISSRKTLLHFTGGRFVKAFNTIWYKHLVENGNVSLPLDDRQVIPVAGDDPDAKAAVGRLIEDIGFSPLDTGSLVEGSKLQGVYGILYAKELSRKEAKALIESETANSKGA